MSWFLAGALGLAGSACSDAFQLATILQSSKAWPWRSPKQRSAILSAILLRLLGATTLSAVLALDGRVSSVLTAFIVGLAAPVILQRLAGVAWAVLNASPTPVEVDKPPTKVGQDG